MPVEILYSRFFNFALKTGQMRLIQLGIEMNGRILDVVKYGNFKLKTKRYQDKKKEKVVKALIKNKEKKEEVISFYRQNKHISKPPTKI